MAEIDTRNIGLVGVHGDDVVSLKYGFRIPMSEAPNVAAYIAAMSFVDDKEFDALLAAIRNT